MATYRYICRQEIHEEPLITELTQSLRKETPAEIPCKSCGKKAKRYWMGLNFYAIVPGAHGGGPATR